MRDAIFVVASLSSLLLSGCGRTKQQVANEIRSQANDATQKCQMRRNQVELLELIQGSNGRKVTKKALQQTANGACHLADDNKRLADEAQAEAQKP